MNLYLTLLASNGMGAGKTECSKIVSKVLNSEGIPAAIKPMAGPLKEFLVSNGFLSEFQAYNPFGKKSNSGITVIEMPAARHLIEEQPTLELKIKKVLQFINVHENARNTLSKYSFKSQAQARRSLHSLMKKKLTARAVMQLFGTEVMRTWFLNDVWVRANGGRIAKAVIEDKVETILVDDVRFANELDVASYVAKAFGNLFGDSDTLNIHLSKVFVHREEVQVVQHASEGAIKSDNSWITLYNDSSLEQFSEKCRDACSNLYDPSRYSMQQVSGTNVNIGEFTTSI